MWRVLDREGVQPALDAYARWRAEGPGVWNLSEYEVEHVGRRLVREKRYDAAIAVLKANTGVFADSPLALYHLGRAYAAADDDEQARLTFERSLRLEASPDNPSHAALAALQ
jgi:tetratricopeptide (TPR) repeat protein